MDVVGGLSAVKTGFDLLKEAREQLRKNKPDLATVVDRIAEAQSLLLDAQSALNESAEENRELKEQADERHRLAEFAKEFTESEGVYWRRDIPYCPNCWNSERKPIQLTWHYQRQGSATVSWQCPIHSVFFKLKERR